jgi:seryl-tRNA synthetase
MRTSRSIRLAALNEKTMADQHPALFRPMGASGLRAGTALFEDVVDALSAVISTQGDKDAERLSFPPVMSRSQIEASGYLKTFPNLLGCVCCMEAPSPGSPGETAAGVLQEIVYSPSDLVLTPSSCYPLYPIVAAEGPVPDGGRRFDIASYCFRREPSEEIDRLQSFRMREFVCIGSSETVMDAREAWMIKGEALLSQLGLQPRMMVANDPFFCPGASFLAASQRARKLKYELVVDMACGSKPTACMSFNYHHATFGEVFGLELQDGSLAHSACMGVGMDRLALALFSQHGLDTGAWPAAVRSLLRL